MWGFTSVLWIIDCSVSETPSSAWPWGTEEFGLGVGFFLKTRRGARAAADGAGRSFRAMAFGRLDGRARLFVTGLALAIFLANARPPAWKSFASALASDCLNSVRSALNRLNCLRARWASRFAALRRRLAWRACSRSNFNLDSAVATRMRNICTSPTSRCEVFVLRMAKNGNESHGCLTFICAFVIGNCCARRLASNTDKQRCLSYPA